MVLKRLFLYLLQLGNSLLQVVRIVVIFVDVDDNVVVIDSGGCIRDRACCSSALLLLSELTAIFAPLRIL